MRRTTILGSILLACVAMPAATKPIAYAQGHTAMVEHGGDAMREVQYFYAPRYWWSAGIGHLELGADTPAGRFRLDYARINWLVRRWNLPAAQANVFAWGSLGRAQDAVGHDEALWNIGGQVDYETRRVYSAFKFERFSAGPLDRRIDTLQLGVAPYAHDWDRLASWFLVQARRYHEGPHAGTETALMLRFFKGGFWLEAGVNDAGEPQAMLMLNF